MGEGYKLEVAYSVLFRFDKKDSDRSSTKRNIIIPFCEGASEPTE